MSHSILHSPHLTTLQYMVTHVFCPLRLPDGDDHSVPNDCSLAAAIVGAAHLYSDHNDEANMPQWRRVSRMLESLQTTIQFRNMDESQTLSQLASMDVGDILAFLVRAQNAAVLFRKHKSVTVFESFELSPKAENVMTTPGKLLCSYPGPAIEIPNAVFEDNKFLTELANFLAHMNNDLLDAAPTSRKANSTVIEERDTTHPRYITELLTGILRSVGHPADVLRITKRIGDDVTWNNSRLPWRRSSLWLLIRVAIQTSLYRSALEHHPYKQFMLFFMCRLANDKIAAELSNDLLQFMSAKISRRLRKLGSSAPEELSRIALQTCTSLRSILEKRWDEVQAAQRISPPWNPSLLDLTRDIDLSLLTSGDYIRSALADRSISPLNTPFQPAQHRRGSLEDFLSHDGAFFGKAYDAEPYVALYDVEHAVEQDIDVWVNRVTDGDEACEKLELLANKYSTSALKTYGDNPELLSVMLLTTIELWVALDKLAVLETPMLEEYSPEVPVSLLECLLLSRTGNLLRLQHAHTYLSRRHSESHSGWSAFSSSIATDSFAIRFYRSSSRLQHLKSQIEEAAQHDVREKVSELGRMNARYAKLKQNAAQLDHDRSIDSQGRECCHNWCNKCSLEREYRKMRITVHEWPLPAGQLYAEAVTFELDCPVSFNMWRSATFHLLVDLCSPSVETEDPYILLPNYAALQQYLVKHPRSRITLASNAKPFVVTHYREASIPTTQTHICVNNGLKFYGFDTSSHARIPLPAVSGPDDIQRCCTYELRGRPYMALQKYIDTTSHTSNEVLASQADCSQDISLHEYISFGHLRSGDLLQWLNILRELRGRSLTFRRHDVHFLFAQAASQVGPLEDAGWKWHRDLQEVPFCEALLGELEGLVRDVEANWLEVVTMDTISFLLRRLLASSPKEAVSLKALELLRTVRSKVFSWVQELSAKLAQTPGDDEFRGFLRDAAAICRSTFNVDPSVVQPLLDSPKDIAIFLFCAVLVHDHTPGNISSLPAYSRLLLDRDRRLSLVLESAISDVIQADSNDEGIDLAVSWVWPDYRPRLKWYPLRSPNSRWFWCSTAATTDQSSQKVHFNILDGSLLVNGKPLGRLPSDILRHPLYNLIFGEQVLDVIPSDLSGTDYSTRATISDHQVYLSLRNDSNLVIKAKRQSASGDIMELIPQEKLEGDLPAVLIEGHTHWLNLSTSIMEIRPLNSLWEGSLENWKMDCTFGQYRMQKGNEYLVDIRSQSWAIISRLMQPLDAPQNLLVYVSPRDCNQSLSSMQLTVSLPRYTSGLSFFVDEDGDLQSCNMRDMVYDEDQSIGTWFGLVNRLILRSKNRYPRAVELTPRCILIPDGKISFRKDGHHVRVEVITPGSALERITYQTYKVDTDLGCLTGNVSLTNKLYCIYLHALSSGCGPDPLTGRTGTEEALSFLRSAGCSSIMRFGSREAELLRLIASICPARTWYPKHLQCMQMVEWHDLPTSTQHHELYVASKAIKEHYEKVQPFLENQSGFLFKEFPACDDLLLERSALRAAYLSPSEFSGCPSSSAVYRDLWYSSRDLVGAGEQRAYIAATSVHHRTAYSMTGKDILSMMESWKDSVSGTTSSRFSARYDSSWLSPDLPRIWLKAYKLLRRIDGRKWFQLLFSLPAMAYASSEFSDLVPVFIAFAQDPHFQREDPPPYESYDLKAEYRPSEGTLRGYISNRAFSFGDSPESSVPARRGESSYDLKKRQFELYNGRLDSDITATVRRLMDAWPCETPPGCRLDSSLYRVSDLTSDIQKHFSSCYHNLKLKEHLTRVQDILDGVYLLSSPIPTSQYSFQSSSTIPSRAFWSITLDQLFARLEVVPSLQAPARFPQAPYTPSGRKAPLSKSAPLDKLLGTVKANAKDPFQRDYVSDLQASARCFRTDSACLAHREMELPTARTLEEFYARCRDDYVKGLNHVKRHFSPRSQSEQALAQSGQWPRITPHALFRSLASNSPIALSDEWKGCLVQLTLLALELQRARRLLRLHRNNLPDELRRELQNKGCDGWVAEAHPDWLLIQLQSNLLVRRVQAEVASEMIAPGSGSNTAMQLNMGEGKSSVIVPIVVAALADGTQLVRVIVPKALTAQMFNLLVDRLSGLVNRRIYLLPFSRSLEVDDQKAASLRNTMAECMAEGGILVVQPEHILSLKLVSVEKQLPEEAQPYLAGTLLGIQKWLHSHSRDILDESDEILHVRYQLVYTIGNQTAMEGSPERWTTTQQVLALVCKYASSLQERFPLGVDYQSGPSGSFPHLRILHAEAGEQLISWVVQDVIDGRLHNFNFGQLCPAYRDAIRDFISCENVPPAEVRLVEDYCRQTSRWGGLLLLRGLFATGILLYALRDRRWRVDYGLAPPRTMLAVPYRAKDVPAQRAEFGHPDIAILLTCLSYYYRGLSEKELTLSFEMLLSQDDPSLEYNLWIENRSDIPECLRTSNGINIQSLEQRVNYLCPLFSKNQTTVDFYLSNIVFPKEAKEFPSKLSCSGWDLAEKKERLLTGFSGTNDGRYLLPLHITQRDPDHQRGTNAKVLSYLLQPENKDYMCMTHENGERRTTHEFLGILTVQQPEIRVLLDVGAQMLDLENYDLARTWLDIDTAAPAAIYFNKDDELMVLTRDGSKQPFIASPFTQQLDRCVVYLDDAHTRGTDIKFPSGFRAAVTLGPKVTKDRLAQGCMRMRKLGHGHSLMFFAPLEIDRRIRSVAHKGPADVIDTMDILQWAIRETCDDIQHRAPHWAQQGMDHSSRYSAWTEFCSDMLSSDDLSDAWLQPEAKMLEELHGPHTSSNSTLVAHPEIHQHCVKLGVMSLRDVSMDEEQEREVVHEVEREQQVERPPRLPSAAHSVHPDVEAFVKTGFIRFMSKGFRRVVDTLDVTSAAANEPQIWSPCLLATADFEKTVKSSKPVDDYMRPVMWVVSGRKGNHDVLVILSPYEVNKLLPYIRSSDKVHLHLYTPRITKSMKPCDDLALHNIPTVPAGWTPDSRLVDQLNVFAGQLYLKDYEAYIRLCRFLCVYARDLEDEEDINADCDGFISPNNRPNHLASVYTFQTSPLKSVKTLMGLRRKGMGFALTDMGKLLDGRLLDKDDFQE